MTDDSFYNAVLIGIFLAALASFASLMFATAPYGRHEGQRRAGPTLPVRVAWIVMESPSVFAFAYFFAVGAHSTQLVPLMLFATWQAHYVHRTLIYPFQMRVGANSSMPVAVVAMGVIYNTANSFVNATWISTYGAYPTGWLADPRFVVGLAVFVAGYVINRHSDAVLRALRKPGETGYKVPRGGLYEWVSCPNYLGELLTWTGWTIATWSLAGLSFAVFTAANLVPRALANHRWYHDKFDDYPPARRAVIPYIL